MNNQAVINFSNTEVRGLESTNRLQAPRIMREKSAPTQQPRRQTLEGAAQQLRECKEQIAFPVQLSPASFSGGKSQKN